MIFLSYNDGMVWQISSRINLNLSQGEIHVVKGCASKWTFLIHLTPTSQELLRTDCIGKQGVKSRLKNRATREWGEFTSLIDWLIIFVAMAMIDGRRWPFLHYRNDGFSAKIGLQGRYCILGHVKTEI